MRFALILAGGSGTRLWPLSRDSLPKQLAPLASLGGKSAEAGKSLLEEAYDRLEGLVPESRRFVCGAERHRAASVSRIPSLATRSGSGLDRYLGEPQGRDTLAALALSSAVIAREDPEAIVAVFTSDHVIRPEAEFRAMVDRAYSFIEANPAALLTFGVRPDRAATGFGYLELGPELARSIGADGPELARSIGADGAELPRDARRVACFREKPEAAVAAAFFAAGPDAYLWNSGMFLWRATRFLELVGRYEPEMMSSISRIASLAGGPGYAQALVDGYPSIKKISVDYGIMEPASRDPDVLIAALPLALEWLDIGSWPAYAQLLPRDEQGNASVGETALVETRGSIVVSTEPNHLVACLGCDDLVVVHTPDATLVCPKDKADELKKLYAEASARNGGAYR